MGVSPKAVHLVQETGTNWLVPRSRARPKNSFENLSCQMLVLGRKMSERIVDGECRMSGNVGWFSLDFSLYEGKA